LGYTYLQYTRIELLDPWCPSFGPNKEDRAAFGTLWVLFGEDALHYQWDLSSSTTMNRVFQELRANARPPVRPIGTPYGNTIWGIIDLIQEYHGQLLYGIGRGSCSSPIVWPLLNQLIMTALDEEFDCISLMSVDEKTIDTHPGDSFVYDMTTGATYDQSHPQLVSSLRKKKA
jgi:hypothetical protein